MRYVNDVWGVGIGEGFGECCEGERFEVLMYVGGFVEWFGLGCGLVCFVNCCDCVFVDEYFFVVCDFNDDCKMIEVVYVFG